MFQSTAAAKQFWKNIPGSEDGVTNSELKNFLIKSGKPADHVDGIFDDLDVNDDNIISFDEFIYSVCKPDRETNLKAMFKAADTDGSGELTYAELLEKCPLLKRMKNAQSEFQKADKDGSSTLTMQEFVDIMNKCGC